MYLIWISTNSDWLVLAEDLGDFGNLLLSVLSSCIASFMMIAMPEESWMWHPLLSPHAHSTELRVPFSQMPYHGDTSLHG